MLQLRLQKASSAEDQLFELQVLHNVNVENTLLQPSVSTVFQYVPKMMNVSSLDVRCEEKIEVSLENIIFCKVCN